MSVLFVGLALALVTLFLFSFCIVKHFSDPCDSPRKVVVVNALTLTFTLLTCFALPLDVYATSLGLGAAEAMKQCYFALFGLVVLWVCLVVPFNYFFVEEEYDDDETPFCEKVTNAAKYTIFFFLAFLVLLVIGLAVRPGHEQWAGDPGNAKWIRDVFDLEHAGESALMFVVACLICVGMLGWVLYAGYGVGALPIMLIRGRKSLGESRAAVEEDLARVRDRVRELQAKPRKRRRDLVELARLQKQERLLSLTDDTLSTVHVGCVSRCLALLTPFRVLLGVALLAYSLTIMAALGLTSTDKALHSLCGTDCGFVLATPQYFNPLDHALVLASPRFPLDYALFASLVMYLFVAALYGLITLGVRLLCIRMVRIKQRATSPQGMLVACAILMVTMLALNAELLTLSPQYATFGAQTGALVDQGALRDNPNLKAMRDFTSRVVAEATGPASVAGGSGSGRRVQCMVGGEHEEDTCDMTSISRLVASITVGMPVFSLVFYFANWAFLGAALASMVHAVFCKRRLDPYEEFLDEEVDEDATMGLLAA